MAVIAEVGVGEIWLTPIHPSPSYHMCDVADYYAVDPAFGVLTAFRPFVDEVHAKALSGENTTVRNPGEGLAPLLAPCGTLAVHKLKSCLERQLLASLGPERGLASELALVAGKLLLLLCDVAGLFSLRRIPAFLEHQVKELSSCMMGLVENLHHVPVQRLVTCLSGKDIQPISKILLC